MNMFVCILSLFSALVFLIILLTTNRKEVDTTWRAFSSMVLLNLLYDVLSFVIALGVKGVAASILRFAAVVSATMAVFEFHYYLMCFLREKKKVRVKDLSPLIGGLGALSLIIYTVFNVLHGEMDVVSNILSDYLMASSKLLLVLPDLILILKRRKNLGRKNSLVWSIHLISVPLVEFLDAGIGSSVLYFASTATLFLIYVTINQETELEMKDHALELEKNEMELKEVKRHVMISQIQPHFIYNVLNIICILCRRDPKEAAKTTRIFARYLRMNVESLKKDKPVPFEEELLHAKTYLSLEKVRFRDELEISYDIGPTNFCIPTLSLQPMVENAVKHGLCMKEDGVGHLRIMTKEDGANWYVIVSDDGVGYDTKKVKKDDGRSHIGVENTKMRVEMMSHGKMDIFSIPGSGTNVVISIPKVYDSNCLPEDRVWEKEDVE